LLAFIFWDRDFQWVTSDSNKNFSAFSPDPSRL
jgi:hypothetical protein